MSLFVILAIFIFSVSNNVNFAQHETISLLDNVLDSNQKTTETDTLSNIGIQRLLATTTQVAIVNDSSIPFSSDLKLFYDPPNKATTPHALGLFVYTNLANTKIYYDDSGLNE